MIRPRLFVAAAALLLVSACAGSTPPALSTGDVELSRSELYDELERLGVELGPTIARSEFDNALSLLAIATLIDSRLADASVVVGPADYEAFNIASGLPVDFTNAEEGALGELNYRAVVKIAVLAEATGRLGDNLVAEFFSGIDVDPRFGTFGPRGIEPPAAPGFSGTPELFSS